MVSGTISLPSRGTFHHSLTVLIHYRSSRSIQAYQVVLADSHRIPRAPRYSGTKPNQHAHKPSTRLSRSTVSHPRLFNSTNAPATPHSDRMCIMSGPTTPHAQPSLSITHTRFSHHPLSLATTNGISLPVGTKMFHFPTFPPHWLLNSPAGNTP